MKFIAHRINTVSELRELSVELGVEVDLRDAEDGEIYIAHDPFVKGENFEDYLKVYNHSTMILNIKSERIEFRCLELLEKYCIKDYFFLDSSFPMIYNLTNNGVKKIALRYSEFEGMDTLKTMKGKVDWLWVDCFTKLPVNFKRFSRFKDMGYKLCLVSPELQGRSYDIKEYKAYLHKNHIVFDAICTKAHNVTKWL